MKLNFVTVDVFTGTQFAGNPLGVILNAKGLTGGQMQTIAAEFNLAETTFVLPPKDPASRHFFAVQASRFKSRAGPSAMSSARCRLRARSAADCPST